MIVVRMKGGLGNQMFQFAYGFAQASRLKTRLVLDRTFLENYPNDGTYTKRNYALDIFKLEEEKSDLTLRIPLFPRSKIIHDGFSKAYRSINKLDYIKEEFHIDPHEYISISDHSYVNGYWQNPVYFSDVREEITKLFTIDFLTLSDDGKRTYERIENSESCSLHIRGGDYKLEANQKRFGQLNKEYYRNAIAYVQSMKKGLKFFIFSNDFELCNTYLSDLKIDSEYVRCNENENHHLDILLMSACKYNISSNSSFSWWANFFSEGDVVIIPKKWFADQPLRSSQIAIDSWVRL